MTVATVAVSAVYTSRISRCMRVNTHCDVLSRVVRRIGALSVVYLAGAGNLFTAPVGVAGIGAALLATAACVVHDRIVATDSATTGEPLQPFL
jgi:hypothetical protein